MQNSQGAIVLCLAYIVGLIATYWSWGRWGLLLLAIPTAWCWWKFWRKGPPLGWGVVAIAVALLATVYLPLRFPHPSDTDISQFIKVTAERGTSQFAIVQGVVDSYPHVTRNHRSQFWLKATQLNEIQGDILRPADISKPVTGKVYVTVPLISATGLQPGVEVSVTGTLYLPQVSANPGGLDFREYLMRSGAFAGMRGVQLQVADESQTKQWSWGKIRQRIVAAQVRWLDIPAGPLVSAMVMGAEAVDIPSEVQDSFVRVGLAHALAASGFQVSLILNALLSLTRGRLSSQGQFNLGLLLLLVFLGLTGFQPAVMRSVVMGVAVLIALRTQRQVNPLNALLLAATLLLLINPLWIWDIGFQLSFLATLGLIVTVEPLQRKLDWLPPTIADLITVPLAATIWTLPLQLYVFKVFPLYSLPANMLTSPLISIVSMGGMISAIAGTIFPLAGSAMAAILYLPTHLLIAIVQLFNRLPATSIAVGEIATWQFCLLYALILLVWLVPKWQKRWLLPTIAGLLVVVFPLFLWKATEFQITALAAGNSQILVVQDRGKVLLINSGNDSVARFTVIPFLQQQAINHIDAAIELNLNTIEDDRFMGNSWQTIADQIPIERFYRVGKAVKQPGDFQFESLSLQDTKRFDRLEMQLLSDDPPIMQLNLPNYQKQWSIVGDIKLDRVQKVINNHRVIKCETLYWTGSKLNEEFIDKIKPSMAIASTLNPDPETLDILVKKNISVYYTGRDGAMQWTPENQFEPYLDAERQLTINN
jgi:competence protein ComEC